ncbi:hypothetical protein B0H10DRAFT_2211429 [Mycena sp. CBHHK59/15]|nr:hypothetical protein B0H10DRAFT_2211429 [Mycena sp. CBHHK59/15]
MAYALQEAQRALSLARRKPSAVENAERRIAALVVGKTRAEAERDEAFGECVQLRAQLAERAELEGTRHALAADRAKLNSDTKALETACQKLDTVRTALQTDRTALHTACTALSTALAQDRAQLDAERQELRDARAAISESLHHTALTLQAEAAKHSAPATSVNAGPSQSTNALPSASASASKATARTIIPAHPMRAYLSIAAMNDGHTLPAPPASCANESTGPRSFPMSMSTPHGPQNPNRRPHVPAPARGSAEGRVKLSSSSGARTDMQMLKTKSVAARGRALV